MPDVFFDDLPVLDIEASPASGPVVFSSNALVSDVVDGDTLRLSGVPWLKLRRPRVRFIGVDCPELDGPYPVEAQAAKSFVESLLPSGPWDFTFYGLDAYGRFVARSVHPSAGDVSLLLLAGGLGWPLDMFPRPSPFSPPLPPVGSGLVQNVVDGDTVDALLTPSLSMGAPEVRLFGVDAPEMFGPFATYASSALLWVKLAARGFSCFVQVRGRDRYGRLLASVTAPGAGDLSAGLIARGLGRPWSDPWPDRVIIGEPQRLRYLLSSP